MRCRVCGTIIQEENCTSSGFLFCPECHTPWISQSNAIHEVLRYLVTNNGIEVFNNKVLINSVLADLAQQRELEREKIRTALSSGAGELFYQILKRTDGKPSEAGKNEFLFRLDKIGFSKEFSEYIFDAFLYAIEEHPRRALEIEASTQSDIAALVTDTDGDSNPQESNSTNRIENQLPKYDDSELPSVTQPVFNPDALLSRWEQGDEQACYRLGWIYMNGAFYAKVDYEEAIKWFTILAEKDVKPVESTEFHYESPFSYDSKDNNILRIDARFQLGRIYDPEIDSKEKEKSGFKDKIDIRTARKWYESAGKNGHMIAQYRAGVLHWNAKKYGSLVARKTQYDIEHPEVNKPSVSKSWYLRAAESGYVPAQTATGICCEELGQSLIAKKYFEKAAEQGDSVGMFCLGHMYYNGKTFGRGIEKDLEKAYVWFEKAALAGYLDARVPFIWKAIKGDKSSYNFLMSLPGFDDFEYEVGMLYYDGCYHYKVLGLHKSISKAIQYLKKSAEQGNNPKAQYQLGYIYEKGKHNENIRDIVNLDTRGNLKKARKYYEMAAAQGHDAARRALRGLT